MDNNFISFIGTPNYNFAELVALVDTVFQEVMWDLGLAELPLELFLDTYGLLHYFLVADP